VSYASVIYIELFNIFGFSFHKYFLLLKGLGFYFINKNTFSVVPSDKLHWMNAFFLKNFTLGFALQSYKKHKKKKYLAFKNYKRFRIQNNLPVRGQRTQTNARTRRFIRY